MPGLPHRPEMIPALARGQFPVLMANPGVVYLDSAATTQKPQAVIDAVTAGLAVQTANPGRGSYPWSTRGARRIAEVREQTARFIGASSPEEIVFTPGATAGLNAVALSWGLANLADGDEILFSLHDHTSNVYPWMHLRQVLARFGRNIALVPYAVTAGGEADTADIAAKVSPRTRLITVTHVHNVFGSLTTLEELRGRISRSVRLCFDCSQSAGHIPVDVADLDCDFAAFSGHKMFGVAGTGVLYARRRVHPELAPFLPGGGSGVRLLGDGLRELSMPEGLEGGTPDLAGITALGAAMEFIDGVGIEAIAAHNRALTRFLVERLRELPRLTLLPGVAWAACPVGHGIVSFRINGVRSDDVGFALSSQGFYVRTGNHCLPTGSEYEDSVRVSVQIYNSGYELERFVAFLSLIAEGTLLVPRSGPASSRVDGYDRTGASRILAGLAFPRLFASSGPVTAEFLGGERSIGYRLAPLTPAPGSHLTASQQRYLTSFMQPCPESLVTSATHRVTWNDSHGVPNVAHAGPSSLGPMVPIVAREATLALWRALAADDGLAARIARLDSGARRVLEATTTDVEPLEIFRIGVEATARTLVQHGYIAGQTPYHTPAQFARGLRDSGIFAVVAGTWYWELQASTFRRGMIPVSFVPGPDATVRYPPDSATMLRAMKEATIGRAHAVMAKAVTEEKLTVAEAVQKYYHELDLIAKQYALLPEGEQPRCLGQMAHTIDGQRFSVQPGVVAAYVETFVRLLTMVQITLIPGLPEEEITDPEERTFHIPDMNCKHCRATITTLLESMDAPVAEIDPATKRVVASFRTVAARERAFDAIRDAGYTVVPPR